MNRLLLPLIACLYACSPAAPDQAGFQEAAALAGGVVTANVTDAVDVLSSAHSTDVKVSCEGYEPEDGFPACELSRDAAVGFVTQSFASFGYSPETVTLGTNPAALNVVAERRGDTRPGEVVLVAAHLDAFYSGADDNSSQPCWRRRAWSLRATFLEPFASSHSTSKSMEASEARGTSPRAWHAMSFSR
jgi:hypothetical protein